MRLAGKKNGAIRTKIGGDSEIEMFGRNGTFGRCAGGVGMSEDDGESWNDGGGGTNGRDMPDEC